LGQSGASNSEDGLDQRSLIRACMQLARRLKAAGVPGELPSLLLDAARWLEAEGRRS
jgi:hypothetical protein